LELEELAEVITEFARRERRLGDFQPDIDELRSRVTAEATKPVRQRRAEASVALALAEEDPTFRMSKPELNKELGRYALAHEIPSNGSRRPILEIAEQIVRLALADRRLRGRHRGT
jgi:hypothetical protein